MTAKQRFIKYIGILLAGFLIAAIALGAFSVLEALLGIESKTDVKNDYINSFEITDEASVLQLDIAVADVKIVKGDSFVIATDNTETEIEKNGSVVKVTEKKILGVFNTDRTIKISIPENMFFERVSINAGAGEITAEFINTEELNMNLGAGDILINSLNVTERATVNTAAGELTIKNADINNLNMDLAVGDVSIKGVLSGKTDIDCSVGDIDIALTGSESDYSFEVDKGISSVKLNGKELPDEAVYGEGKSFIEIDGGAGKINIKTENAD